MYTGGGGGGGLETNIYQWIVKRMNECLMTSQHKKHIGYWVSEKFKCDEMVIKLKIEKY